MKKSKVCITFKYILIVFNVLIRKLDHPHIVKFYGTSLLKKADTTRVILVLEKCKGNLKSQIFDNPEAARLYTVKELSTGTSSSRTSWYDTEICVLR